MTCKTDFGPTRPGAPWTEGLLHPLGSAGLSLSLSLFTFFFKYFAQRERESTQAGGVAGRGRRRSRELSREPDDVGLDPRIMT